MTSGMTDVKDDIGPGITTASSFSTINILHLERPRSQDINQPLGTLGVATMPENLFWGEPLAARSFNANRNTRAARQAPAERPE